MTVQTLINELLKLDFNQEVMIWAAWPNGSYCPMPIQEIMIVDKNAYVIAVSDEVPISLDK